MWVMMKNNTVWSYMNEKGILYAMFLSAFVQGCGGGGGAEAPTLSEPKPVLLTAHSMFERKMQASGVAGIQPQPARLSIWSESTDGWVEERIEDPDSNVFHKALPFENGILTLSGEKAMIKHWTRANGAWSATEIWSKNWGGKFNRMRDVEFADLNGDGAQEMIVATHDQGVLAVGSRSKAGTWTFVELGQKPDTFVHEIEVGDVDGDGQVEFYGTPSERNRGDLSSQAGGVVRYVSGPSGYVATDVANWPDTHAKEIFVTKETPARLFAVKEASATTPVQVVSLVPTEGVYVETVVATVNGEKQARFLTAGDPDGDGVQEFILAGKNTGLWLLEPQEDGTFSPVIIDATSGGFEHATHVADMDGDGTDEVYVASERPGQTRELRQYKWDGKRFRRYVISELSGMGITWHLYDAKL